MALAPRNKLAAAIVRVVGVDPHSSEPAKRGLAPYFGAILRGLIRREMDEPTRAVFAARGMKPTMGVSPDGVLTWAPEYVDSFADDKLHELAYSLLHEVMHIALKHHERAAAIGIVPEPTEEYAAKASIANMAQDACCNEEIEKVGKAIGDFKIPQGWILPETLNQPRGLVFEERYRRLLKDVQSGGQGSGKSGKKVQPGAGKGWCGGCAGHPQPGEPEGGKSEEGRSEAEMERFRKESAEAVKQMASGPNRGLVPDSLVRWADDLLQPPKIDWRTKLARMIRGAVAYRAGVVDLTFSKVSRRQAGVGFGVGRPIVPAFHAPVPSVGCIVDTSGSMSSADLAMAASEIQGVLAAVGASVAVVVCDAAVHGVKDCATISEAIGLLKGGGGTDMTPGFTALEKCKNPPSVVICLTDGHIGDGHPPVEPAWASTIWVVVGEGGNEACCSWGEIVKVTDVD